MASRRPGQRTHPPSSAESPRGDGGPSEAWTARRIDRLEGLVSGAAGAVDPPGGLRTVLAVAEVAVDELVGAAVVGLSAFRAEHRRR